MKSNEEEEDGGAEGRVTELGGGGGCGGAVEVVVLHSLPEPGRVFFPPHQQWQSISIAPEPSLSCHGIFLFDWSLLFIFQFSI